MTIPQIVYLLCTVTSLCCALLLGRAYRATRVRLLFWSTVSFGLLALSNVLLFADLVLWPVGIDLQMYRHGMSLAGLSALLYGLIEEKRT
jgi:hypothetical protein